MDNWKDQTLEEAIETIEQFAPGGAETGDNDEE